MSDVLTVPIKILVVDADEAARIFLRDIFWVHGVNGQYTVKSAETLNEADSLIQNPETRPNIVFTALMVPTEKKKRTTSSQIEHTVHFIERLKGQSDLKDLKIVVFSSQKDEALKKEVLALGVEGFLTKGHFMPREIIEFTESVRLVT